MMEPLVTFWPSKRFVPRRWALLSLPFLELPRPFLCAITSKYGQLLNFLGKVNNAASVEEEKKEEKSVEVAPQPEPLVEEKKEVVRVADSDLVRPTPVKVELPYWLL